MDGGDMDRFALERALAAEREMGAINERLRAHERTDADLARADEALRRSMSDGLRDVSDQVRLINDSVARSNAHILGEMNRLDRAISENRKADEEAAKQRTAEEKKRNEEIILQLKVQAEEAKNSAKAAVDKNRPYVAIIVFIGLLIQWVVENLSTVGRLMESMQ